MSTFRRVVDKLLDLQIINQSLKTACASASRREDSLRDRLNRAEEEIVLLQSNLSNLNAKYTMLRAATPPSAVSPEMLA